jgi:hypothetical protein
MREQVGGRGNWNLSTKAAHWKEALEGNDKGACQKSKDDNKMQIDLVLVGEKKTQPYGFGPRLEKLTPELQQKLMQEKKCFQCRQVGHMANSDKCPLFNAAANAKKLAKRTPEWEWKFEKKDQTQNPPAYAHVTQAPAPKPPTLEDLVTQIKNLSHEDLDKLLEKIIATVPKEDGDEDEKELGF